LDPDPTLARCGAYCFATPKTREAQSVLQKPMRLLEQLKIIVRMRQARERDNGEEAQQQSKRKHEQQSAIHKQSPHGRQAGRRWSPGLCMGNREAGGEAGCES